MKLKIISMLKILCILRIGPTIEEIFNIFFWQQFQIDKMYF